jgi:hypothetical protein
MQSGRCLSRPQSHLVARTQTHRRANARRDSGSAEGPEPRDFPNEFLRRTATESADREIAHTPQMADLLRKQFIRNVLFG